MAEEKKKCAHCGKKIDDVFSSCPVCGEPLCDDCSEGNCPTEA
jgi:predicted amidophosphoribosyltransferase